MTEKAIQEGLQDVFQGMDEFANEDVVINDYSPFDLSTANAPYIIIENSDEFESTQDSFAEVTTWNIPWVLVERFTDWNETQANFRTRRQAIIDKFNSEGNSRSAGGVAGVNIRTIRTVTPILEWYSPDVAENQRGETFPVFIFQRFVCVTEER
jgi:hypothetical protein